VRKLALLLATCAQIGLIAPAAADTRSTAALHLQAFFSSPNLPTACGPEVPPGTSCKALRASASVRGLGAVRLEGVQAITDPGFHVRVSGRLVMAEKGSVEFEADNDQTSREIVLALRIRGGTGVFAGASGTGTYQIDSRTNTTSLWDLELTAPGYEFDLRAPQLVVSTAAGKRRGAACVIRVAYRANDERQGPVRVSLSAGPRTVSSLKPAGVLSVTVRRAPRVLLSLVAVDESANTARSSVAVRC
jgi:hypothetical protein